MSHGEWSEILRAATIAAWIGRVAPKRLRTPGQRGPKCLRFLFRRVEFTVEKARVERHLAAILAADVAGYSRLMSTTR